MCTYSQCVSVGLVTQHSKCTGRILMSVACLAIQQFSTPYQKRHDIRKKHTAHKMRVLIFSTTAA